QALRHLPVVVGDEQERNLVSALPESFGDLIDRRFVSVAFKEVGEDGDFHGIPLRGKVRRGAFIAGLNTGKWRAVRSLVAQGSRAIRFFTRLMGTARSGQLPERCRPTTSPRSLPSRLIRGPGPQPGPIPVSTRKSRPLFFVPGTFRQMRPAVAIG